jgi:chemosensory pili system protein ChpB (putative protein-glutamate methylesterase)
VSGHPLRIGLLAHTQLQQHTLRSLVEECGHRVGRCLLVADLEKQPAIALDDPAFVSDAWIVAIDAEADDGAGGRPRHGDAEGEDQQPLEQWLERNPWLDRQSAAVIFCEGTVPATHAPRYAAWSRRLKEKLNHLTGAINLAQTQSAQRVWVLVASTGGPAAVKQFLAELPPRLGIGFIYVQHIGTSFKDTLAQVMSRGSHYPARVVEHGSVVRPDEVAIISPDCATELLPNGTFVVHRHVWSAPYRPSADYIVANVAQSYGARSGVIIFTGMGNDGAASSRLMRQKGGQVWVQTPASCTSDSMPAATLAAGCVSFKGRPCALAQQLVRQTQSVRQRELVG